MWVYEWTIEDLREEAKKHRASIILWERSENKGESERSTEELIFKADPIAPLGIAMHYIADKYAVHGGSG